MESNTSKLAILALVFAFLFPLLGFFLGIIALVRINKDPTLDGKNLAIGAIVASLLWGVFFIALIGGMASFGVLSPSAMLPDKCL